MADDGHTWEKHGIPMLGTRFPRRATATGVFIMLLVAGVIAGGGIKGPPLLEGMLEPPVDARSEEWRLPIPRTATDPIGIVQYRAGDGIRLMAIDALGGVKPCASGSLRTRALDVSTDRYLFADGRLSVGSLSCEQPPRSIFDPDGLGIDVEQQGILCARFSPDGRSIVVTVQSDDGPSVSLVSRGGAAFRQVGEDVVDCRWLDGTHLLIARPTDPVAFDVNTRATSFIGFPPMWRGWLSPNARYALAIAERIGGDAVDLLFIDRVNGFKTGLDVLRGEVLEHRPYFPWRADGNAFFTVLDSADVVVHHPSPLVGDDVTANFTRFEFRSPFDAPQDPDQLAFGWLGSLIWFGSPQEGLRLLDPETSGWRLVHLPSFIETQNDEEHLPPVVLVHGNATFAREATLASAGVPRRITERMRLRFDASPSWEAAPCSGDCSAGPYGLAQMIDGRSRPADEHCGPIPITIGTTRDPVQRVAQRLRASVVPSQGTSVTQSQERIGANTYTHIGISFIECGVDYWVTRAGSTTYIVRAFEYLVENDPSVELVMESLRFG